MSKGLNQCTFVGRLGGDGELKYTQGGQAKLNMRLAVDESYKDKDGNEKGGTTWITLTMWGKGAEGVAKYMVKGQQLTVSTRLHSYAYYDRDGNKRYATEFIVQTMVFGASPKGAGGTASGDEPTADPNAGHGTQRRSGGQSSGGSQRQQRQPDPVPAPAADYDEPLPDSIPF